MSNLGDLKLFACSAQTSVSLLIKLAVQNQADSPLVFHLEVQNLAFKTWVQGVLYMCRMWAIHINISRLPLYGSKVQNIHRKGVSLRTHLLSNMKVTPFILKLNLYPRDTSPTWRLVFGKWGNVGKSIANRRPSMFWMGITFMGETGELRARFPLYICDVYMGYVCTMSG